MINRPTLFATAITACIFMSACTPKSSESTSTDTDITTPAVSPADLPLNLTVYLDLSDRLLHNNVSNQRENDSTIINYLFENIFLDKCKKNILRSKDHFQIFFYPAPTQTNINTLSRQLNLDLAAHDATKRRNLAKEFQATYAGNISTIYDKTLESRDFPGCDIWGFFSNRKVDTQCIRDGYRNVLVILTDGYLYHSADKIRDGKNFSYVLDQTLDVPGSSLIVKRDGLQNLEVLLLEINPTNPKRHDRLFEVLQNWFEAMGVQKIAIEETDVSANTIAAINNFFK